MVFFGQLISYCQEALELPHNDRFLIKQFASSQPFSYALFCKAEVTFNRVFYICEKY